MLAMALLMVAASYAQENQVDADLKFGKELYQNKMYDLAEEQFSKFLRQYPTSPSAGQARYYLAKSQFEQKKFSDAARNFQAFAVQFPSDPLAPKAWTSAGESYADVKDYADAGLSYERLRVFYPKDVNAPTALLKAAEYFKLAGDTARAEVSLLTIVQDYSTSPTYYDATLQLGDLYFGSGQLASAENQYKGLLTSDNDSVRVMGLYALGRLNRLRGMPVQAAKYLNDAAALRINPRSSDAVLENIEIDLDAGNFAAAREDLGNVDTTVLTPGQMKRVTFEKAYAGIAVSGWTSASRNLSAIAALPASYRLRLAALLKTRGSYKTAISIIGELPKDEQNETNLALYSEIAYRAGRVRLADSLLTVAASLAKTPDVRLVIQLLNLENGRLRDEERARETFYRYEGILKERPDAYAFFKARSEEGTGDYAAAVSDYSDIMERYPESDYAVAADSLARYDRDFREIDYRDAVVSMADILLEQGSADRTRALFHLGKLYENDLKDYTKAAKVYKELSAIATGDTQRVAKFLYAAALSRSPGSSAGENSDSYSIYSQLSAVPAADSIAEKSLYRVAKIQAQSGDSLKAENSALEFTKRFPNAAEMPEIYTILAGALYSSGAYHDAVGQARLAGNVPEAKLIEARSLIAIDSVQQARSALESLMRSGTSKKYRLKGELMYADLVQKIGLDAAPEYAKVLDHVVPSEFKDSVTVLLADYLYASQRYDSAYAIYSQIGEDKLWYTTPPSVLYRMATCKLNTGDLNTAKGILREILTNPGDSTQARDAYYQLGNIYATLGDMRMSASFFERAGEGRPDALVKAADTYFSMGDYDDAGRVYSKIVRSSYPDSVRIRAAARLVRIEYKSDKLKIADADAAKFKKTYGGDGDDYYGWFLVDKAEYFIRAKKYDEASRLLKEVRSDYDKSPAYPQGLLDQAQIFVERGDLKDAEKTLKDLLKSNPSDPVLAQGHLELGNIYYAQEKYQDASDNFRAVYLDSLAQGQVVRDAMSRLISSYESLGMYDGALDVTRKFIARFPDDKTIMDKRIKVGILYEELRYFDQALLTFQGLVKEANRDYQAELHYYVGAIYDDKGDYANAILEFLKVPYLVTPSAAVDWAAQAYYMAGKCYEKLNKPDEAIAMYQKIVDKPNTDPTFIAGAEREINRVKALLK